MVILLLSVGVCLEFPHIRITLQVECAGSSIDLSVCSGGGVTACSSTCAVSDLTHCQAPLTPVITSSSSYSHLLTQDPGAAPVRSLLVVSERLEMMFTT